MATYDKRRVFGVLLLVYIFLSAANWHFGFVFPRFARLIAAFSVIPGIMYINRFAPDQYKEHRRNKNGGSE
ncbi:MAG: hypothetical protein ACREV7_18360 [Steroidobacteraceae bacterium]